MKKSSVQLMARITAGLGFLGCVLIVINVTMGSILGGQGATLSEVMAAALPINMIVGLVGTATFILGIILIAQFGRLGKPATTGILLIIAGIFAWIITFVSLVLWVIAGIFLLRLKFDEEK